MSDRISLRERFQNIWNDWTQPRREIRMTAIGWNPGGWWLHEDGEKSVSGTDEYSRVIRLGSKWKGANFIRFPSEAGE